MWYGGGVRKRFGEMVLKDIRQGGGEGLHVGQLECVDEHHRR